MSQTPLGLQQARRQLLEHGACQPGVLDEQLAQSWQRSLRAGIQPHASTHDIPDPLGGAQLDEVLHHNADLLAHARPVMDFVYHQIRGSHCMVVLADAHSLLLRTQGDRGFLNKAQRVALSPGADWHETCRGTNAIGTALVERAPVRIRGGEHFLEQNGFLHCAAAPIFNAQGEVAGVIDISGEPMASQSHTLGMASMAARMIENSWLKSCYPQHARIHLHTQPQGLDTPAEGIVIMTGEGMLVGANQAAMAMLKLTPADFFSLRLESRLQARLLAFLQNPLPDVQALRLPSGARLYLRIHAQSPRSGIWHAGAPATDRDRAAPAAAPQAPAQHDALSALDTGDAHWREATQKVRRILARPIPLLIQGESGVGKEVFARAAHDSGPRKGKPFIAINCAAIPESLIEAELFGYAPGAYTGAQKGGGIGRIREADGGTLFLDEIGDMPLPLQTRLLRVLQERQVTPLGGGSPVDVDFAVISATHCPLDEAMAQGRFRSDLYYRINGFSVHLPPLRARTDFDALVRRMLDGSGDVHVTIDTPLMNTLRAYAWPGNLRQLASTLQTACALLSPGEQVITPAHLADDLRYALANATRRAMPALPSDLHASSATQPLSGPRAEAAAAVADCTSATAPPGRTQLAAAPLRKYPPKAILATVQAANGNVSQAARQLGISRQTIYRHLRMAGAAPNGCA